MSFPDCDRLQQLLFRHVPLDAAEQAHQEAMLRFLRELQQPFSRHQARAHFTGSAFMVDPSGTEVCLIHHRKLQRWLQPGGHWESGDEGIHSTALREAAEETGCEVTLHPEVEGPLDLDVHLIPARPGEPEHLHLDVRFLVVAADPRALQYDPAESFGARWLPLDEASQASEEPGMRRMISKARGMNVRP